jgi:ChrR Cupin-like domain
MPELVTNVTILPMLLTSSPAAPPVLAPIQAPYELRSQAGLHVFDMSRLPWQQTANPGLWLKPVRQDGTQGQYLGLVRFDADARSGLHQHQGVATSFVIDGGLTDYHGSIGLHQAGINVRGSTHDAIAYQRTVLVSRLEGPVSYPPRDAISGVHTGSYTAEFQNPDPDVPPEVNVTVDAQPRKETGIVGVRSQMIFDYAGTGSAHRMLQWHIRPQTEFSFTATGLTEMWVRGGNLSINQQQAHANCFVLCEEGARLHISSPFGALLIVWAQAEPANAPAALLGY